MPPSRSGPSAPRGFVSFIGAGPGDPRLITRLGLDRLRQSEVVIHDRLIPHSLLDEAPSQAELIDVGKAPGRIKISQSEINQLLVLHGSAGKKVVRLKGGDPGVFGRLGEEIAALVEAQIPHEVIPGIPAAVAAAAAAGVPLTHREESASVTFVTVHEDPDKPDSLVNWPALARGGTLALYMAGGRTRDVAHKLIHEGLPPATPVVLVQAATWTDQGIEAGHLEDVRSGQLTPRPGLPFILLVGEVASIYSTRRVCLPLAGKAVAVTHPDDGEDIVRVTLRAMGANVLNCPSIRVAPPEDPEALFSAVQNLTEYDWILLTSKHAVLSVFHQLDSLGLDARAFGTARVAVVGEKTAQLLFNRGIRPDMVPESFSADGLLDQFETQGVEVKGKRFLYPASEIAPRKMEEALTSRGGAVDRVAAYRTVSESEPWGCEDRLVPGGVEAVTFASPSALESFSGRIGSEGFTALFDHAIAFSIGPTTSEALRRKGVARIVQAEAASFESLAESVIQHFSGGLET